MKTYTYYDFDICYSIKGENIVHMTIIDGVSLSHVVGLLAFLHNVSAEEIEVHKAIRWGKGVL